MNDETKSGPVPTCNMEQTDAERVFVVCFPKKVNSSILVNGSTSCNLTLHSAPPHIHWSLSLAAVTVAAVADEEDEEKEEEENGVGDGAGGATRGAEPPGTGREGRRVIGGSLLIGPVSAVSYWQCEGRDVLLLHQPGSEQHGEVLQPAASFRVLDAVTLCSNSLRPHCVFRLCLWNNIKTTPAVDSGSKY